MLADLPSASRTAYWLKEALYSVTAAIALSSVTAAILSPAVVHLYRPTAHVDSSSGRCIKVVNHLRNDSATCEDYDAMSPSTRGDRFNIVSDFDKGSIVK